MPEFINAKYLAPSRCDAALRHLLPDAQMWTGDDQTVGWTVSQIHITRIDIARAAAALGDPWITERRNFEPGWYLIHQNSDGIVWGYFYGSDLAVCAKDFAAAEESYNIESGWTDTPVVDLDENGNPIPEDVEG